MTLPDWLEPMAATLTKDRFATPDWVYERKLDGIRLIAFKDGPDVRLLTRNRLSHAHHYPDVVKAIAALPVTNVILDGEAMGVWREHDEVGLHVFDILSLGGEDLTQCTLDERRKRLEALPLRPPLYLVDRLTDAEPWERACAEGWGRVIAKRGDSVCEHRRSPHWRKMKRSGQRRVGEERQSG
jgi:ATP-dependent DNA ligase